MSTRSFICIEDDEGFRGIYCHYDGYPAHVGKILVEFHNRITAAEALVYGPQIRNFDSDGTVARFGDGSDNDSEVYSTIGEALNGAYDYVYLYSTQTNSWVCYARDRVPYNGIVEVEIPGNQPWLKETANA